MSVQITEVYLVPSPQTPASVQTKSKSVAIVAPQRSNSLDYLNFEEKRQIIASSLSLSDFLHVGNNTKEIKDGVATVIVGMFKFFIDIKRNLYLDLGEEKMVPRSKFELELSVRSETRC